MSDPILPKTTDSQRYAAIYPRIHPGIIKKHFNRGNNAQTKG